MKKFFTSVSYQKDGTEQPIYEPVGNAKLVYEKRPSLPILNVINNCTETGEKIEVIFIMGNSEDARKNLEKYLLPQLDELVKERSLECSVKYVLYSDAYDITSMLALYGELIRLYEDNDEIYSCLTYGTKPIPLVQMMSMRYAYHAKKNVFIGMIVYGRFDHTTKKAYIYDITSMFYMDELSERFCRMGIENPEEKIAGMIAATEGEDNE